MIVLYAIGLGLVGVAGFLAGALAARLERRYAAAAKGTEHLAHGMSVRNGNSNHLDVCVSARKQYQLGRAVHARDRLEAKYTAWAGRHERLTGLYTRLRNWKGRYAPYALGAVDAALVVTGLQYVGVVQVDPRDVIERVRAIVLR